LAGTAGADLAELADQAEAAGAAAGISAGQPGRSFPLDWASRGDRPAEDDLPAKSPDVVGVRLQAICVHRMGAGGCVRACGGVRGFGWCWCLWCDALRVPAGLLLQTA
jgi:hypothetical protein